MSSIDNSEHCTRAARNIIKGAIGAITKRERGADRQVRRLSYDIDDPRAQVFQPIADGTRCGGLAWTDDVLKLANEYDVVHKKPGERGPLQANGIRVLEVLLKRFLDFKTGRLDPAYDTIQAATGLSRNAVAAALRRLKQHGFLDWVRRSIKTGNDKEFGPQREQTSNAYVISLKGLAKGVHQRFRDLREARRRRAANSAHEAAPPPSRSVPPPEPGLSSWLDRLGASVANASPQ